jgi:hypothetical protein
MPGGLSDLLAVSLANMLIAMNHEGGHWAFLAWTVLLLLAFFRWTEKFSFREIRGASP